MLIHLFVFKQPSVIFIHDIRILILTIIFACHTVFTYKSVFMILIPGAYTSFICIANTLVKSDISKNFAIFLIKSAHLHGRCLRIIRCQFICCIVFYNSSICKAAQTNSVIDLCCVHFFLLLLQANLFFYNRLII